jgi:hypothetical protein
MSNSLLLSPKSKTLNKKDFQKDYSQKTRNSLSDNYGKRESYLTKSSFNEINSRNSLNKNLQLRPSLLSLKIQKSDKELFSNKRKDAFGNEILKGSKEHKVSFIDQVSSKKISEIVLLENYYYINKNNNDPYELCKCNSSCYLF